MRRHHFILAVVFTAIAAGILALLPDAIEATATVLLADK
jgi:hypothetical protein